MKALSAMLVLGVLAACLADRLPGAESLEPIHLPPPQKGGGMPLMQALNERMSTKEFTTQAVSRNHLSNLLWAAFGINRPESGKRTVATAANCQDIQVYVVFENAAYVYDAEQHCLIPVVNRDVRSLAATQEYAQVAPINLVYVSDFSRMADRFQDKKPIYAAFHAGSISQNVYLYCASAGLASVVRDGVEREGLKDAWNLSEHQVIVMAQSVGYAHVESPPAAEQLDVSVELTVSVEEFDPAKPTGSIRCIVGNRSTHAIRTAESYDGQQIALIGYAHRFPLRLSDRTRDREAPKMILLEPGKERVVFEFCLAEILRIQDPEVLRKDFQSGRRVIVWDWRAMPAPPPSPIHHVGRDGGFFDTVRFRAELTVDGTTVASNEVSLKVKK